MFNSGSSNTNVCFVSVSYGINKMRNWDTDDTTVGTASTGNGPK
jgi:hypothetical protein